MSMVSVSGLTYRIVPGEDGCYDAVRLLDDFRMGSFRSHPPLDVTSTTGGDALLRRIAQAAIQRAQTRWTTAGGLC
jgi:hypothetical protein